MSKQDEIREATRILRSLTSQLRMTATTIESARTHDQLLREVVDVDSIEAAESFALAAKKFHRSQVQVHDCRGSLTQGKRTSAEQTAADYAETARQYHRK
jgi:hypothetical protein